MKINILESEKFLITYEKDINKITIQELDNGKNYYDLDNNLDKLKDLGELLLKFVKMNEV